MLTQPLPIIIHLPDAEIPVPLNGPTRKVQGAHSPPGLKEGGVGGTPADAQETAVWLLVVVLWKLD